MLESTFSEFGEKLRIVGICLDREKKTFEYFLEKNKFYLVEHFWAKTLDSKLFDFKGIPTIYLIKQSGVIVYKGDPYSINLEK